MTRKAPITDAEIEKELFEIEMLLNDFNYRERLRAAWPKAWGGVEAAFPTTPPQTKLTLRLDADLAGWFRSQGRGYQARINAVLRAYMLAKKIKLSGTG